MQILLASKSPRRKQLLEQLGYTITIVHQDIEESFPADLPVHEVPMFLAEQKARGVINALENKDQVILASDTIVTMNNEIFHKPVDFADGVRILSTLQGKTHEVVTGVCLLSQDKCITFKDIAEVTFMPMTEAEIKFYLETYKPYDKAGAYAIQEWIGLAKIKKMNGSYATVMGLPTHVVYEKLQAHFSEKV